MSLARWPRQESLSRGGSAGFMLSLTPRQLEHPPGEPQGRSTRSERPAQPRTSAATCRNGREWPRTSRFGATLGLRRCGSRVRCDFSQCLNEGPACAGKGGFPPTVTRWLRCPQWSPAYAGNSPTPASAGTTITRSRIGATGLGHPHVVRGPGRGGRAVQLWGQPERMSPTIPAALHRPARRPEWAGMEIARSCRCRAVS